MLLINKVKGKKVRFIRQINSIHSKGLLAFGKIENRQFAVSPKNCKLLLRNKSIIWS